MKWLICIGFIAVVTMVSPLSAGAHCDSLDGPVVVAARLALASGDVTPVLKWIHPQDEAVIKSAFEKTTSVRTLGAEARELADMYFFETVVRVHRESEGAPYTGLKAEGTTEPGITMADASLVNGSSEELVRTLTELVRQGVHQRFEHAAASRQHADESVRLGREHVAAYVSFIHYVEAIHEAASREPSHETHSAPSDH